MMNTAVMGSFATLRTMVWTVIVTCSMSLGATAQTTLKETALFADKVKAVYVLRDCRDWKQTSDHVPVVVDIAT